MSTKRHLTALALVALVAVSCTSAGTDPATSTPTDRPGSTSTVPPATSSTQSTDTTTTASERELALVGCDEASEATAIVCEAVELIGEQYVDEIDQATLAQAATDGLLLLDGNDNEDPLECPLPSDDFEATCRVAAGAADDSTEAAEAMVAGLVAFALDPNSGYFDPGALEMLEEEQEGQIEGIGALVSPEDETIPGDNKQCGVLSETCRLLIVSTIEGAPAEAVGLQRDDEIVAVDGTSILGWTIDEVTSIVRGPSGTEVTLTIQRGDEVFDVTITRQAVLIPIIEEEVVGDVGYVRLWNFTGNASGQFEEAVVGLLSEGVDELVVDLRNNPGGFLTTAIDVTSVFLEDGDVVVTEGPDETTAYPVNGNAIVPDDMEVTFVVNKGSASASEVVSATLQERGRATVVGENTFGKNTVQQRFSLSNGGALKLTIARWLTPEGHDFGGTGVTPDVSIADITDLDTAELVAAVTGT